MQKHPTISLCMIVRDEEEQLPRCLESVKGLVDEIIVVDTGSKDKTMEIAHSFDARVYKHPWENDFSAARNISLSYAKSDWILILDADEELEREDIPKIWQLLRSEECEGLTFAVYSQLLGSERVKHDSIRLFKNHKGVAILYYDTIFVTTQPPHIDFEAYRTQYIVVRLLL
ncbi:MAG: glycosyltransferase family 2 protein [bacterium]